MRVPCSCWEVFPDVILIVPYPLCLASIFQRVYLSIFVWWHLLCAFHSSGHWLTPSFRFFFFFKASKAAEHVDCGVSSAMTAWGTGKWVGCHVCQQPFQSATHREGHHMASTHTQKGMSRYWILTSVASEASAWLSGWVFVSRFVCESPWMLLSEVSRETAGAEWPNTGYILSHSGPRQGKTC